MATLEARLAKVELRLAKQSEQPLTSTPASTSAPTRPKETFSVSPAGSSEPGVYDVAPSPGGALYEGTSSFLQQSVQASQEVQRSAAAESLEAAQTVSESFSQLNSIFKSHNDRKLPFVASTRSMPEITPLPASVVLTILRKIKGSDQHTWSNSGDPIADHMYS